MSDAPIYRARAALKEVFGFDAFRPFQEKVFTAVFAGRDAFVVAPTGGGKTMLAAIPALVLPGVVVVISPLIALMKSHADSMEALGVSVCRLTGDLPASYLKSALRDLAQFNLVFVSPEKATTKEFLKALAKVEVSIIFTDEAHAVASLYSTFRASCAHLGDLYDAHPEAVRLACTATADPHIEEDVHRVCCLRNPVRIVSSPWRPNIQWDFVTGADEGELVDLLDDYQSRPGRQIVYAASRQEVRDVAQILSNAGLSATYYHAGMSPNLRKSVQEQFTRGDVRCIVATSAFGMGIDIPDIRLVANWQLPASLFDLAQQGGRASRDGEPAVCWTNLGQDAEKIQRYFILLGNPPWRVYRKLWDAFSRNTGHQRWRGDILLRVAGVGDKMSGQLSAALSYMEFRRQIRTTPAGEVYVLPIRDPVRAGRLAATVSGARLEKGNVVYSVSRGTVDHSKVFTSNGACYGAEPIESVVVTRLVDEFQITPDDIAEREARAEDNLESIYQFAKAEDKKAYLESVMSK